MEGHIVTIHVRSKENSAFGYDESFYTTETDIQRVKYLYHKFTHENHSDVDNAEGSHTLHVNGEYPSVQRLLSIKPATAEQLQDYINDGHLPLRFI